VTLRVERPPGREPGGRNGPGARDRPASAGLSHS